MCHLFDWKDFYSWNWRQIWSRKGIKNLSSVLYWLMLYMNTKTYCVKCRKNTENSNPKIFKTNVRLIFQSKCTECKFKKSRFVKEQKAKRLLSSLGLKTRLSKIPFLGDIYFWVHKMNEIRNKFWLAGDKSMPEMHLKQPGVTYSDCSPFTRNKERIEKFMQTRNTDFIYKNELDKACFQHDTTYGKSKDLAKRTQSGKVLRDKAFKIAIDPKYNSYQRGLVSMVYKFFDKKSQGSGAVTEPDCQLAREIHKQIIRKFKRQKVYSYFRDNIWGVDLDDMQSLNKYNKGIKYLLWAIDLFSKYTWVVPLKDKRGISIVDAFQKIISKGRKPNKIGFIRMVNFTIIFSRGFWK